MMPTSPLSFSLLRSTALSLGFQHCGFAPAEPVSEDFQKTYLQWLADGNQGEMHYLENHLEKRFDPRCLVEGTRTIVSLAMNYRPTPERTVPGIAWYAQGRDYHEVLRERMQQLMEVLNLHGRCFVDSAPVPERYWAVRCGLGWVGRHGQLVIPGEGSTFFLGELFIQESINDDRKMRVPVCEACVLGAHCGSCRRCLDACPSPSSCLNYWLIEYRGEKFPPEIMCALSSAEMHGCFYGCDRCLRACPHLRVSPSPEPSYSPSDALLAMTTDDWLSLTPEAYRLLFRGSAVRRVKYPSLMRNIRATCL